MYQIRDCLNKYILGMANLLNILVNSERNVKKIVIDSSNVGSREEKALCVKYGIIFLNSEDS